MAYNPARHWSGGGVAKDQRPRLSRRAASSRVASADGPPRSAKPQPLATREAANSLPPAVHWAIARLGLVIGEFFDFEELAADSAATGRYTGFFTAAPLHLRGGSGSPGNALAIR